jgi:hypothetical protein
VLAALVATRPVTPPPAQGGVAEIAMAGPRLEALRELRQDDEEFFLTVLRRE